MHEEDKQKALLEQQTKRFYEQAVRDTENKDEKKLREELKRMERKPGVFSWLKDRISSIFNLVKIAALSVLIGRRETARRLEFGTNEEMKLKHLKELEKDIRLNVYRGKLGLETEKQISSEQQEVSEDKKEIPKETSAQSESRDDSARPSEQEKPELSSQENMKNQTILEQQTEQMTRDYQKGLTNYISGMTGISKECIEVKNVNGEIRIDFPLADEKSQYSHGMTLDKNGNAKEDTAVAKALETIILCYTAREFHSPQKQLPGNILSKKECADIVKNLSEAIKKEGKPQSLKKRGHEITMFRNEYGSVICQLDGKELKASPKLELAESLQVEFKKAVIGRKENIEFDLEGNVPGQRVHFVERTEKEGDFSKLPVLSQQLHEITRSEIEESYYSKYTGEELQNKFSKVLDNFQEKGTSQIKGMDFHDHHIHIELNAQREPLRVIVDNEIVFTAGYAAVTNEDIAKSIAISLEANLEREGLFLNTVHTQENEELSVPKLDDNGLPFEDNDSLTPGNDHSVNDLLEFEDSHEY